MAILTLKSKDKLGCNRCDKCCIYRGDIRLTGVNIYQISKYLNLSPKEFIEKYTHELEYPEIALKGIGEKNECILYNHDIQGCSIHKVKPMQCVMFPLVPENLNKDYFYNQGTCVYKDAKKITVKKWLNGNNGIYKKYKQTYIDWIYLIELIQFQKRLLSKNEMEKIKFLLFENYDLNKRNIKKQVYNNMDEVKKILNSKHTKERIV